MEVPQKLKLELSYDPLLDIYPKNFTPGYISEKKQNKTKSTKSKRYMQLSIRCVIYNCQDMETVYVSISRWTDKEDVVCVYAYVYWNTTRPIKKNENFAIFTNMDRLGEHYAGRKKSDREREILYDIA